MGTFLLVVLIIILMLIAAFVGAVTGMFGLVLLYAKAVAKVAVGKVPDSKMKELSETFHRLVEQQLSKDYGVSGAKVTSYMDVEFPDGEV